MLQLKLSLRRAPDPVILREAANAVDLWGVRVRETVRDFAGGSMGELSQSFTRLAALAWRDAWRHGSNDERTRRIVEILNKAAQQIRDLRAQET